MTQLEKLDKLSVTEDFCLTKDTTFLWHLCLAYNLKSPRLQQFQYHKESIEILERLDI